MRVVVLYNPIAGAGRTDEHARALSTALAGAGHEPSLAETSLDPQKQWLDPLLAERDLAVIVGGDGAMRLASGSAARTGTPLYHFPLGTENLLAREFSTDRSVGRLLAAIERLRIRHVDLGIANGRKFLLMASIGFDAEVVHDLASRRAGGISHLSYAGPILRQVGRWRPPSMTVMIDGETAVDERRGFVVAGNSRHYARSFDPACRADMSDGLLDVVFFPITGRLDLVAWAVACRARRHLRSRRLLYERGRVVVIRTARPQRYQLDGDPPEAPARGAEEAGGEMAEVSELRISLRHKVLPILIP